MYDGGYELGLVGSKGFDWCVGVCVCQAGSSAEIAA